MDALVAVPSVAPGGLDAPVGDHYGNCDLYTLVRLAGGSITETMVIPNSPCEDNWWAAQGRLLAENGVNILISGGIGMKPVNVFYQEGIEVYYGGGFRTVEDVVAALVDGRLSQLGMDLTWNHGK